MKRALTTLVLIAGIAVSAPAVASAAPVALPAHPEPGNCRVYLNSSAWEIPQNWGCKVRSAGWAFYFLAGGR